MLAAFLIFILPLILQAPHSYQKFHFWVCGQLHFNYLFLNFLPLLLKEKGQGMRWIPEGAGDEVDTIEGAGDEVDTIEGAGDEMDTIEGAGDEMDRQG